MTGALLLCVRKDVQEFASNTNGGPASCFSKQLPDPAAPPSHGWGRIPNFKKIRKNIRTNAFRFEVWVRRAARRLQKFVFDQPSGRRSIFRASTLLADFCKQFRKVLPLFFIIVTLKKKCGVKRQKTMWPNRWLYFAARLMSWKRNCRKSTHRFQLSKQISRRQLLGLSFCVHFCFSVAKNFCKVKK